ncbi:MAG: Unknown protein [uncultured Aureispira sp.]|uniref:Uncharacterized protein n=1 Tax=uncultured Aureispira sp. TaxID=1331704 RepID=A0A6S6UBM6_9BACT|nr:MAG: Unknown protein [uncultured Aureispira sp.]
MKWFLCFLVKKLKPRRSSEANNKRSAHEPNGVSSRAKRANKRSELIPRSIIQ